MLYGEDSFVFLFILVCAVFFLFLVLISIFGMIFFYFLQKISKRKWQLKPSEIFVVSFGIGLSVYIAYSFILDIFHQFNFYFAYLPIVIIDALFIIFLIYRGEINREKISNYFGSIKKKFTENPRKSIIFIGIIILILCMQISIQWSIVSSEYSIPARDTYGWLGQVWHLLDRGYLWRERHPIHYPKGFPFFIAGPVLIYPDFGFAYFYFKFGGIPLFSFYIIIMAIILKRIFAKNYMILTGLMFCVMSNLLISRFTVNTSSTIPTVIILLSVIILFSKCPFYLTGFFVHLMFLFNALFALCYFTVLLSLIFLKVLSKDKSIKKIMLENIIKPLLLMIFLMMSYIIHTLVVLDITIIEFLNAYTFIFGFPIANLSAPNSVLQILTISDILKYSFPNNDLIYAIRDIEKKGFSFFLLLGLIALFLTTKKHFKKKYRWIINYVKISFLIVIGFYVAEVIFENSSNVFFQNLSWFKWRVLEGFLGPLIIITCFVIEKIVVQSKRLTTYFENEFLGYKKLIRKTFLGKFLRIENIFLSILLISTLSSYNIHQDPYYDYHFEKDHIDTIFYIKDNIPDDEKILVNFYDGMGDALHSLLSTYDLYDWEFSKDHNNIYKIKQYFQDENIKYFLLDLEYFSLIELYNFTTDYRFENLYENEVHIVFEYHDDALLFEYHDDTRYEV